MKHLRQIVFFTFSWLATPSYGQQQSSQIESLRAERFSFEEIITSADFQSIILLLMVAFAGIFLVYLLGTLVLGIGGDEKKQISRKSDRGPALSGSYDTPRVLLNPDRGAPLLRAAAHQDEKSPGREASSSSGRG